MRSQRGRAIGQCPASRTVCRTFQAPVRHVVDHSWHHLFRLAQDKMRYFRKLFVACREEGAAGDDFLAQGLAARGDFMHGLLMHDHGADHDPIRPSQVFISQTLHIQIHELQVPFFGQHGGDGEQSQGRNRRFLRDEPQHMLETPERVRGLRVNQEYSHIRRVQCAMKNLESEF